MEKKALGIPAEVSVYHPIEFLQLDKITEAFLDLGLEELKGGTKSQLLVGHLVHFMQQNGIDAIKQLPRFKSAYLEEIKEKCSQKGIDLLNLGQYAFNLNFEKMKELSDAVSVRQPEDIFDKAANIYSSSNYKMFHFLEFNRKIVWSHVNELRLSIIENGILSYPIMIYTNCVDGEWKYWVVDGQHRFEAFRKLGLPIYFTLYKKQTPGPITLYDLVKLVARINNTSRRWSIHQYLRAWESLNVEEYKFISQVYNDTKIAINILLQAYSGRGKSKAVSLFMDGVYEMSDRENGNRYIEYLKTLKPLLTKSTALQAALLGLFREITDYDNEKMKARLTKVKGSWMVPSAQEEILTDLRRIYNEVT